MPVLPFDNHDACGDLVVSLGSLKFQCWNTLTSGLYALVGLCVLFSARTSGARQSGVILCVVGWLSGVYHMTSSWGGFLLDISSMAVWACHLGAVVQAGPRDCLCAQPFEHFKHRFPKIVILDTSQSNQQGS
eukprot:6472679-Amphidinium_carterae.1